MWTERVFGPLKVGGGNTAGRGRGGCAQSIQHLMPICIPSVHRLVGFIDGHVEIPGNRDRAFAQGNTVVEFLHHSTVQWRGEVNMLSAIQLQKIYDTLQKDRYSCSSICDVRIVMLFYRSRTHFDWRHGRVKITMYTYPANAIFTLAFLRSLGNIAFSNGIS